jgi:nucleotidyltransferase substrate binding protein (TIGR01987 family)
MGAFMTLNTDQLSRSLLTLQRSLEALARSEKGSVDYEIFRNATIKGFELTLEVCGKLLKKVLKAYLANPKAADSLTFKDLFRHASLHGIMTSEEVERWFLYRDNRNDTAHDYGEAFAEETLGLLPGFLEDATRLCQVLAHAPRD